MPSVATEFACPTCIASGKTNRINATDGALICTGDGSHIWKDTDVFSKLQPRRAFTVTPPKLGDSTVRSEMKLMVPTSVKQALETKFGATMESTVIGFMTMLTEGEVLVIPQTDLKMIGEKLGSVPGSSGELKGMVYSATMDRDTAVEAEKIAKDKLAAIRGKNPDMVVINLGDQLPTAIDQARGWDMTLDEFIESSVKNALANNWF
jgi:hypothetical protein